MSDRVRDVIEAIEVAPDTVGLTHAKILRDEIIALRSRVAHLERLTHGLAKEDEAP